MLSLLFFRVELYLETQLEKMGEACSAFMEVINALEDKQRDLHDLIDNDLAIKVARDSPITGSALIMVNIVHSRKSSVGHFFSQE